MKNYKQILEAVNRGIKFALRDLEDEEMPSISKLKYGLIEDKNYTRELLDLKKETIDLGLPSGTLWCKYNLDVDPTQLSKPEDWYGKYYAWGELDGNKTNNTEIYFGRINYKFGKDSSKLTKYCNKPEYGLNNFTDNLAELQPEDDVAYQKKKLYNFKFHIPTKELIEELINCTNNYLVDNYNPNKQVHNSEDDKGIKGLNGRVFISISNGNQLFIPAAGYREYTGYYNVGSNGCLWSKSLHAYKPIYAYKLDFDLSDINTYVDSRYYGFPIRPVINL